MDITLDEFAAGTGATLTNAKTYFEFINPVIARFGIDADAHRISAFLATIGVETAYLTQMQEGLYYTDPARLASIFRRVFDENHDGQISAQEIEDAKPYCRNPKALSQKLYAGFHGRGGCMLSWKANYQRHSERLGTDYVSNPDLLLQPDHAMLIAGDFWDFTKCNDVAYDMGEVTLRVNGPARLALAQRIALRDTGLKALA